ncbi:MAG TPA: VOC family protein [Actinomycetota bacterium]|nr:VOC family protein [Actinomycetota bacterium]
MLRITPHLWYDKEAVEAAEFYVAAFPDARITNVSTITDTPSGDCDIVSFELCGLPFQAISAGPLFEFTPAISFLVRCATTDEVDALWSKLSDGGSALMPLDSYPFSDRYGWTTDRYGLSWQVMIDSTGEIDQAIVPTLMYVGDVCGKAEEAIDHYTSVFPDSKVNHVQRYGEGEEPEQAGTIRHAYFALDGYKLAAMDSAQKHEFGFNEAISLMVRCEDQGEIDHYWDGLSAVPESEQCGWLKDKFGVSWQVIPAALEELLSRGTEEHMARVTHAFLQMKKFDLAELERAFEGAETNVGGNG